MALLFELLLPAQAQQHGLHLVPFLPRTAQQPVELLDPALLLRNRLLMLPHKSAGQPSRRPIQLEIIEDIGRKEELVPQILVVDVQVKAIEPVGVNQRVIARDQQCLPHLVGRGVSGRERAFHQHHPRSLRRAAPSLEHFALVTFDVDLEPVNRALTQFLEDHGESSGGNLAYDGAVTRVLLMELCDFGASCGKATAGNLIEGEAAHLIAERCCNDGIGRKGITQCGGIISQRFDMHPYPTSLVERTAHGIDQRVLRSDIDIAAGRTVTESPPKDDILKVL